MFFNQVSLEEKYFVATVNLILKQFFPFRFALSTQIYVIKPSTPDGKEPLAL